MENNTDQNSQIKYMDKFLYLSNRLEFLTGYTLTSNKLKIYGTPRNGKCTLMVKEIYENIAALIHTKNNLGDEDISQNEKVLCLTIGDGKHPRAGILFALATKWKVISIDPIMDDKWLANTEHNFGHLLPNLECVAAKANDIINEIDFTKYDYVVMIGVHTHADMYDAKRMITKKKFDTKLLILYIPCCKGIPRQFNNTKPIVDTNDSVIPSTKNRIIIWKINW